MSFSHGISHQILICTLWVLADGLMVDGLLYIYTGITLLWLIGDHHRPSWEPLSTNHYTSNGWGGGLNTGQLNQIWEIVGGLYLSYHPSRTKCSVYGL